MKLSELLKEIVFSTSLENKLTFFPRSEIVIDEWDLIDIKEIGRAQNIQFEKDKKKFPKVGAMHLDENKAYALHSFANHELLAIEVMAATLLKFPIEKNVREKIINAILKTITDEQLHFKLYSNELKKLNFEFGSFGRSDFFWKYFLKIKSFPEYFALMSLTFESANLDFAFFYKNVFKEIECHQIEKVLEKVLVDEFEHVSLGYFWLQKFSNNKDLWEYYRELLPQYITPMRAKGIAYNEILRYKANLPQSFVEKLSNFQDEYAITNRKK